MNASESENKPQHSTEEVVVPKQSRSNRKRSWLVVIGIASLIVVGAGVWPIATMIASRINLSESQASEIISSVPAGYSNSTGAIRTIALQDRLNASQPYYDVSQPYYDVPRSESNGASSILGNQNGTQSAERYLASPTYQGYQPALEPMYLQNNDRLIDPRQIGPAPRTGIEFNQRVPQSTQNPIVRFPNQTALGFFDRNLGPSNNHQNLPVEQQRLIQSYNRERDSDEKMSMKDSLTELVATEFSQRLDDQKNRLRQLQAEVESLAEALELRDDNREQIVKRRVDELLKISDPLSWNYSAGTSSSDFESGSPNEFGYWPGQSSYQMNEFTPQRYPNNREQARPRPNPQANSYPQNGPSTNQLPNGPRNPGPSGQTGNSPRRTPGVNPPNQIAEPSSSTRPVGRSVIELAYSLLSAREQLERSQALYQRGAISDREIRKLQIERDMLTELLSSTEDQLLANLIVERKRCDRLARKVEIGDDITEPQMTQLSESQIECNRIQRDLDWLENFRDQNLNSDAEADNAEDARDEPVRANRQDSGLRAEETNSGEANPFGNNTNGTDPFNENSWEENPSSDNPFDDGDGDDNPFGGGDGDNDENPFGGGNDHGNPFRF